MAQGDTGRRGHGQLVRDVRQCEPAGGRDRRAGQPDTGRVFARVFFDSALGSLYVWGGINLLEVDSGDNSGSNAHVP